MISEGKAQKLLCHPTEVISEGEARELLCHPTEVISEDETQKLLCHPTEMMAEDEAKKTKETYFLATHDERKLSTGNDQGFH